MSCQRLVLSACYPEVGTHVAASASASAPALHLLQRLAPKLDKNPVFLFQNQKREVIGPAEHMSLDFSHL